MSTHYRKGLPTAGFLNCIVVEDNTKQSALLREYIAKTPKLNYCGKCGTAAELIPLATQSRADIVFWEARLLDHRILTRLKETGQQPVVVCITGKSDAEKKEMEMDIFNYLYRPLAYERFLTTIQVIRDYLAATSLLHHGRNNRFVFIKSEYRIIKVKFEDILFCEGMKDYTQIYVKGKTDPILTLNNLKSFFSRLPPDEFFRVHRSYIVSLGHIDSIVRNEIYIGKKIIPIGDSFKDDFYQVIEWNS